MTKRLFLSGIALALLAGCQKPPPVRNETPRPVRTLTVDAQRSQVALTLPAEVRPRIETRYGFRVGGKIAQRLVSVGDTVAPGQLLAKLDPQDLAPAVAAAQSQLDAARTDQKLARIELNRLRDLRQQNFVSQAQVDRQQAATEAADARVRSAQAQLTQAGTQVEFQSLKADVHGVVMAIEAEAGQVVAAGQPVVRVARGGDFELAVNVPEKDLAIARAAGQWRATIAALGGEPRTATLRELSPVADPASRTYPMRLTLRGDLRGIALGMSATVQALHETMPAFVLPLSALYSLDGKPHVWLVAADQTVQPVPVATGGFLDEAVRITAGLSAGDRVVTAGANLLVAGQKVRLLPSDAAEGGQ